MNETSCWDRAVEGYLSNCLGPRVMSSHRRKKKTIDGPCPPRKWLSMTHSSPKDTLRTVYRKQHG